MIENLDKIWIFYDSFDIWRMIFHFDPTSHINDIKQKESQIYKKGVLFENYLKWVFASTISYEIANKFRYSNIHKSNKKSSRIIEYGQQEIVLLQ